MKRIFVTFSIPLFFSCSNTNTMSEINNDTIHKHIVGNDKDEHNCIGSAGYTWSIVKNRCIRMFEDGIRLNAVAKDVDTTTSAFIVFKSNATDTIVELFLPTKKGGIILQKNLKENKHIWKNDSLELHQLKGTYSLNQRNGHTLYKGVSNNR